MVKTVGKIIDFPQRPLDDLSIRTVRTKAVSIITDPSQPLHRHFHFLGGNNWSPRRLLTSCKSTGLATSVILVFLSLAHNHDVPPTVITECCVSKSV